MTASAAVQQSPLFPPLESRRSGRFCVDNIHTLYWEESGNAAGLPVLVLHGGPGGGCAPEFRRFFDPKYYRIIMFDQRGAGLSTPSGECRANTSDLLIEDIEALRQWLGVAQWLVFGGSWGATLALAYGQTHPAACLGFILRSIFLCSSEEIDWFLYGGERFHPEIYAEFVAQIPVEKRSDLLAAYRNRLASPDPDCHLSAARSWSRYEQRRATMHARGNWTPNDALDLQLARLEVHYFSHLGFFEPEKLLTDMARIQHLPAFIVQGRYDVLCPPVTAFKVLAAWPGAIMMMVEDAGHTAFEHGMTCALVDATEAFRQRQAKF